MAEIWRGSCLRVALFSSELSLQGSRDVLKTSTSESYGLQMLTGRQLFFAGTSSLGLPAMSVIEGCHTLSSSRSYDHPGVIDEGQLYPDEQKAHLSPDYN